MRKKRKEEWKTKEKQTNASKIKKSKQKYHTERGKWRKKKKLIKKEKKNVGPKRNRQKYKQKINRNEKKSEKWMKS